MGIQVSMSPDQFRRIIREEFQGKAFATAVCKIIREPELMVAA